VLIQDPIKNDPAFWREKIEESKKFDGSDVKFCALKGISYTSFRNRKHRMLKREALSKKFKKNRICPQKKLSAQLMTASSGFARVDVRPELRIKSLPDPRWLADLIFHLQEGLS
jgi:hypothetical protein